MRALLLLSCCSLACVSLAAQQRERISAYKSEQSREFVTHLADAKVDPRQADIMAVVTADALNAPLQHLEQAVFPAGSWEFVPTQAPRIELNTGSALLRVTGIARKRGGGQQAEVTVVAGLTARWNENGSHMYFKPSALAVVPTVGIGILDFALGSFIRNFAEKQAGVYLAERIGEIDIPVELMLPVQRRGIRFESTLVVPDETGATLRYELPEASAQVKLTQLYLWLLEGKLVVLAFADVVKTSATPAPPPRIDAPKPAPQVQR
jgi:hypothetical protein